jgi:methylase of polypeptide subunit release factors
MNTIPKKQFIDSTRDLINGSTKSETVGVIGLTITTNPEVFNPVVFFSSQWFATEVARLVVQGKVFIEVGCGTGIVSIKAAKENPALVVYATDINPMAAETTKLNAATNDVGDRITTYCGDVFDSLPVGIRAQNIFWSMPFGLLDAGDSLNGRDWQVFDPGYRAIKKFFATAKDYLAEGGRLLIGFSEDIGHMELLEQAAKENRFSLKLITKTQGMEKDSVSMEIWEGGLL